MVPAVLRHAARGRTRRASSHRVLRCNSTSCRVPRRRVVVAAWLSPRPPHKLRRRDDVGRLLLRYGDAAPSAHPSALRLLRFPRTPRDPHAHAPTSITHAHAHSPSQAPHPPSIFNQTAPPRQLNRQRPPPEQLCRVTSASARRTREQRRRARKPTPSGCLRGWASAPPRRRRRQSGTAPRPNESGAPSGRAEQKSKELGCQCQ